MPVSNLLELNPDKLFEEHSISEIQEIQKKLQTEIDRKREELRTMVGERYRDLIEAADTIADMKATAEGIVSHIDKMTDKCKQLQEQQLLGFTPSSSTKSSSGSAPKSSFYSVAVQIRVLIVIPEHIWIAFDEENYLRAAQLFLFARHLNTGLQLQSGGDSGLSGKQIEYLFPVVERQWSTISDFLPTILKNCEEKIKKQDATNDEVAKSLCAFALLEGLSSQQLLTRFLELRTRALQRTFQSESYTSVKACVLDSVKLLVQTFSLLQACFVGTLEDGVMHEGLIYQILKSIVGQDAPPSISLIDLRDTIGFKLLPSVILEFRPSSPQQVDPLLPGLIKESLSSWVDATREYVCQEVTMLLKLVRTLRGLAAVRAGHAAISQDHAAICRSLLVPQGADLWGTFFRPSLSSCAHSLVDQQWCSALQKVKSAVGAAVKDITYIRLHEPEQDLRWFVWKEWETDLPQADQEAPDGKGLLMKAKGYSPRIEKLCSEFDSQLEGLLKDLNHYIEDRDNTSISKSFAESSEEHSDRKKLQEHLQKCSLDNMKQLVNYVLEKQSNDSDGNPLLLARFLQAMCDLCPHLQQCLMPQSYRISVHSSDGPQEVTPWQEVCNLLKQESLLLWNRWKECSSKRIQKLVGDTLFFPTNLEKLMCLMPQWDVVTIEEEGEGGHRVQSKIRVPSQPSLPLQTLLNNVCHEVNAVAPHTLPRPSSPQQVDPLLPGLIKESLSSWVDATREYVCQEVTMLLKLVRTLRGLAAVRAGHAAISQDHAAICRSLLVPQGADLWGTFFRPSLSSCAHSLVDQQWCSALQKVKSAVGAAVKDITYIRLHEPEQDLRWFVWKEWETDLPQADQEAPDGKGLLMKAKGYSPRIEKLCSEFDSQLEGLLKDLNHYIEDRDSTSISKSFAESSEEHSDRKKLQEHLQKCSLDNMKQLVNYVLEKQSNDSDGNPLLLARFLQAMCDLCPHLQQCLMPQSYRISVHSSDGPQEVTPWQEVCNLLKQESLLLWNRWKECSSKRIQKLVGDTLFFPTNLEKLMCLMPQWDVVTIEEEGEGGHRVQSKIRVPSQPSLPLQTLLNNVCHEVNAVAPHTLPRKIHQDLVECIIGLIFDFYKTTMNTKPLSQAQSLQFLLDVKYLTLLLVPRDNKVLMGCSQELCEKLESEVDPFDLDVFSPYIQNNIKRSVQRTQGLLGILVAWPEKLCHTAPVRGQGSGDSSASGQTGGIDDPSVLPLGPTAQWFPLLPVTGPASGSRLSTTGAAPVVAAGAATVQQADKSQPKKAPTPKQKIDPSPGEIVRSGAAAFFGAMSTDWFG
ncbi:conserved oligomeric Golgi complex subunit 1 [Schistocerca piceifrons]|uniref:conserved oligomeric Golgi complex subunit 1 n=1 Tax=Schistocerca piceifrons TaxID=274613 RepID=UPI001F5FC939|nr:conserved oligomeric Golgi complex subunit 1 [Schistocerca piceifrons]